MFFVYFLSEFLVNINRKGDVYFFSEFLVDIICKVSISHKPILL